MDLYLKDKVIVVTGGSSGIGKGICMALVQECAIPFIIGRNKDRIDSFIAEIEANGGKAGRAYAELTDPTQCENAIKIAITEFGKIDGLINNAGINDSVGLEHGTYEAFIESLHKNVIHYYHLAKLVLPELKKNKGAIVNIGSKTSITGQGGTSGYAAANGARNALTREWAVELLPYSIRVNAVIVAECYTPLYKKWINTFDNPETKLADISKNIPLENRMTTEQEIADTVLFLMSSRSSHTTGQLLFVDGGYTHLDRSI
ncbi:SDR family oxidoreductase [Leeuwenhoekiella sp. NPDC079379]|uniref:SDR family oxidoreductase n=1 Tax=Leeuwenhoekiella sp. NPDC079379 TaxID=3364122 RepID=UPI0037CAF0DC